MRIILKQILLVLAKISIHKHNIRFIVVVGWYGTDLVKEGIYNVLSERLVIRRNIQELWWDFSIPLEILGYKDIRYKWYGWIEIILRSIVSLLFYKSNPQRIILSLNMSDKNTAEYWSKLIKPETLVITNFNKKSSVLIEKLIEVTANNNGKVLICDEIEQIGGEEFLKFGLEDRKIITPNQIYAVNEKLPVILLQGYPAIFSVAENYGWDENEIYNSIIKFDAEEQLLKKVISTI